MRRRPVDILHFEVELLTDMFTRLQGRTEAEREAARQRLRRWRPLIKAAIRDKDTPAAVRERFKTYDRTLDHGFGRSPQRQRSKAKTRS